MGSVDVGEFDSSSFKKNFQSQILLWFEPKKLRAAGPADWRPAGSLSLVIPSIHLPSNPDSQTTTHSLSTTSDAVPFISTYDGNVHSAQSLPFSSFDE
ncbi:hypothetical protein DSO57_1007077 [Entomophthora muscae]|uniref:Uncharacterized protein n=1 Tax=Entomophthora muscae TaxID=34485 RepID=A0ACC2RYT1_9FUNG|nr:hypothetical protein DSO57_1007077 [Entomophthora muscae]